MITFIGSRCLTSLLLSYAIAIALGQTLLEVKSEDSPFQQSCGRVRTRSTKTPPNLSPSPLGSSPWHTAIYTVGSGTSNEWNFICSGNIISPNMVLTAASCVFIENVREFFNASILRVVAAKTRLSLNDDATDAQPREVYKIYPNEQYEGEISGYSENLAILNVEPPFAFNEFVHPICIDWNDVIRIQQSSLQSSLENIVEVAGWGLKKGTRSVTLKEGRFELLRNKECRLRYKKDRLLRYINYDKFCLLTPQGRIKEDSGSGVVTQFGDKFYLTGIISVYQNDNWSAVTNMTMSRHRDWLKHATERIKKDKKCKDDFLCSNNVCIPYDKKCNGIADCADKSDEDRELCGNDAPVITVLTRTNQGMCTLPIQLGGASYRIENCESGSPCTKLAGTKVYNGQRVLMTCGRGTIPSNLGPRYACLDGVWFQETPSCVKMCPPRQQTGVTVQCHHNGVRVNCTEYMKPGTEAISRCKRLHRVKDPFETTESSKCLDGGKWSAALPTCIPECGVPNRIDDAIPTITYGSEVAYGRYPWHLALYRKNETTLVWDQICSGTLLSPNIVLTAAHCVHFVNSKELVKAEELLVAAGKVLRDLNKQERFQQISRVKEVIVPDGYEGFTTQYEYDIALLDLTTLFNITDFALPCCIDYLSTKFSIPPKDATVMGWGYTEKGLRVGVTGIPSPHLMETEVPLIGNKECKVKDEHFKPFITFDKFCGVYRNGSGPQKGDSGGGVIVSNGDVYYLIGVISIKPTHSNEFGAFTSIGVHRDWIRELVRNHQRW